MERRRRICLTIEQKAEVVDLYRAGHRMAAIATHFGCQTQTIQRALKDSGQKFIGKRTWSRKKKIVDEAPIMVEAPAPKIAPGPAFYSPSHAEIARLKAKGLGNTRIAALLRLPYRVVEGVPAPRA